MWLKEWGLNRAAAPRSITPEQKQWFSENGYLILPRFIIGDEVDAVLDAFERAWADRSIYNNLTISVYTGTAGHIETYVRNVDPHARRENFKLNHLYLYDSRVMN